MNKIRTLLYLLVCLGTVVATSANATVFEYSLSNKNPGAMAPPDYGLRLDNLFGTGAGTAWTFSFTQTDVKMVIDTDSANPAEWTAHIFGEVIGGNETGVGSEWTLVNGKKWELDFTYTGINITDTTTGFWTASNSGGIDPAAGKGRLTYKDSGSIDGQAGDDFNKWIGLADYRDSVQGWFNIGGPSPQGPYVSSWLADTTGFVNPATFDDLDAGSYNRNGACCKDFGFRAERVPEPASLVLMGLGLLGLSRIRRKI